MIEQQNHWVCREIFDCEIRELPGIARPRLFCCVHGDGRRVNRVNCNLQAYLYNVKAAYLSEDTDAVLREAEKACSRAQATVLNSAHQVEVRKRRAPNLTAVARRMLAPSLATLAPRGVWSLGIAETIETQNLIYVFEGLPFNAFTAVLVTVLLGIILVMSFLWRTSCKDKVLKLQLQAAKAEVAEAKVEEELLNTKLDNLWVRHSDLAKGLTSDALARNWGAI